MTKKIVPWFLILLGAALLLGVVLYFTDKLTAAQPVGLGQEILGSLGGLSGFVSAITGIIALCRRDNGKDKSPSADPKYSVNITGNTTIGDSKMKVRRDDVQIKDIKVIGKSDIEVDEQKKRR